MTSEILPAKQPKPRPAATPTIGPAPGEAPPAPVAAIRWLDGLLLVAFLGLTFLLGAFPMKDTDFWWHLRTGDLIRETGTVPQHDLYTYSVPNNPWIDLHWIYQLAISWIYQSGGVPALTLAKCAVTTLAVFFLVTARRRDWPLWVTLTIWLPALLVLAGRMYIRPETLTLLYLSIFLAVLSRLERMPWLVVVLPIVQIFWVNTQGLFIFGPVFYGVALVDAALRPGAFAASRSRWWRIVGGAGLFVGLACLVNPYGVTGALYPLQLASTMGNPVFSRSIAELTPILEFIKRDKYVSLYSNLTLHLHFVTLVLGALSFLIPIVWSVCARLSKTVETSTLPAKTEKGKKRGEKPSKRATKKAATTEPSSGWRPSLFRLVLFVAFSVLSFQATRNSHQFAAVVGTITAWNFAEWASAVRRRSWERLGRSSPLYRPGAGIAPRLASLLLVVGAFVWVATGGFYAAANEGRTIGLGVQPLWYPLEAVQFAGTEGFPPRFLSFHNGHSSLYAYYFGPERKVYADARLEVIGPELYSRYIELQHRISRNDQGWSRELDEIGRPVVLVDLEGNAGVGSTLLASPDWRCVWLDAIAAVFVHVSYGDVVNEHAIDFDDRHFRPEPYTIPRGADALLASAKGLRNLASLLLGTSRARALALMRLGADHARRAGLTDPDRPESWKLLGQFDMLREAAEQSQRFRRPFDPVFDLSVVRATHEFRRALALDPHDYLSTFYLQSLFEARGMTEARLPLMERLVTLPPLNGLQSEQQKAMAELIPAVRSAIGAPPPDKWANLDEFARIIDALLADGRAATAADYLERAVPAAARTWEESDRIATLRLHLGETAQARAVWLAAPMPPKPAVQKARIAVTHLVDGDFEGARVAYREALALDPELFEAHYGFAVLEEDAGRAPAALASARRAVAVAPTEVARTSAQAIVSTVTPYANAPIADSPR